MLYTNEEMVNEREVNALKKIKVWKNNVINGASKFVKNNRILIVTLTAFLVLSIVNCLMICTFFKILQMV